MISTSSDYKSAIVADSRRMKIEVLLDFVDPDIVYEGEETIETTIYAKPEQLRDKVMSEGESYATLELNRWMLNGSQKIAGSWVAQTETAFEGAELSGEDCSSRDFARILFRGISKLQSVTIVFSDRDIDAIPEKFDVTIYTANGVGYRETITGNRDRSITLRGFTVANPRALQIISNRLDKPYARTRVVELIPGIYEKWIEDDLTGLSITRKSDLSALTLPYGTARIGVANIDGMWNPRNKSSLFQSLEDRQSVKISIGPDGAEMIPIGTFYQFNNGWKTMTHGLSMDWNMVDVIGLLAQRKYEDEIYATRTLEGWIRSILVHLGTAFRGRYIIDGQSAGMSITTTPNAVQSNNITCGQLLLWLCQRVGLYPVADATTGYLRLREFSEDSGELKLDNLSEYPVEMPNEDFGIFAVELMNITSHEFYYEYFPGTNSASPNTVDIRNPFIAVYQEAEALYSRLRNNFGGNITETIGRGDPSQEIGDIISVEMPDGLPAGGRITEQSFAFSHGVLQGCRTRMVRSDVNGV